MLNSKGCTGCHSSNFASGGLNLAVWPFVTTDANPQKTDDLAEILARILTATAPGAASPMPPFGAPLTEEERSHFADLLNAIQGEETIIPDVPGNPRASTVEDLIYDVDTGTWNSPTPNFDDRIRVSWEAVADADSYNIYRGDEEAPVGACEWCEVWNDEFGKWVYMDASTVNHYIADEETGEPLSLLELHEKYLDLFYISSMVEYSRYWVYLFFIQVSTNFERIYEYGRAQEQF